MLDASAAGREFGGDTGFNEGFGFLDALMNMKSGPGCSNSGGFEKVLAQTSASTNA